MADFDQFLQLKNQPIIAAENFGREENLPPMLTPTMSINMDGQLKLAHNLVDVVDGANRKIRPTLLLHSVDKPEKSYAQVHFFARTKEGVKFHQIVYLKNKPEEIIYLLDILNSVNDKVFINRPFKNFLWKINSSTYSLSILFLFESRWVGTIKIIGTSLLS